MKWRLAKILQTSGKKAGSGMRSFLGSIILLGAVGAGAPDLAFAQISVECLNDPACQLEEEVSENSVISVIEAEQASERPPKVFLINRNGALWTIPFGIATDASLQDIGIGAIDGDPYWDWYGNGVFYVEAPYVNSPGPVMHVNLASKQRTEITTQSCILDDDVLALFSQDPVCGYMTPIVASSNGGVAFIQQVLGSEQPNWHVVISEGGDAMTLDTSLDAKPKGMAWSENGDWLLYPARVDSFEAKDLRAVSKSGKQCDYPGVDPRPVDYLTWTGRNGGEVVYSAGGDLWLVPLKPDRRPDRCPKMDLRKKLQLTATNDHDERPQWLEVGNLVAFLSNRPSTSASPMNLWAINLDTLVTAQISTLSFVIGHADWQSVSESARSQRVKNPRR
jgi:hypothetical protein